MNRRDRDRRRRSVENRSRRGITSAFRSPGAQIAVLAVVALIVFLILQMGNDRANTPIAGALPATVNVSEAYEMYHNGAFVLDVRTVEEWNEFHAPNTTLIPLDQLASRLDEIPRDRQILVVCRSGNRSQQGRDILLNAGFTQVTSMAGGLNEWRESGFPIDP